MSRLRLPFLTLAAVALASVAVGRFARAEDPPKPAEPAKPAEKPKEDVAPAFKLKDVDGKEVSLADYKDKWVVLEWTNYNCPFVKKHYNAGFMQKVQKTYTDKGVVWLSICSSAPGTEGNKTSEEWKKAMADWKVAASKVLLDTDGAVGKAYGAKTTPDMRIISPKGVIVYAGAFDADKDLKADPAKTKNYVVEVLDAVLANKPAPYAFNAPYGCSVKYAKP